MMKLKPCPFCGGEAELVNGWVLQWVRCKNCTAQIAPFKEPYDENAIEMWNCRVELTNLELDEKLQKKYDEGFMDGQDYAVSVM